MIGKKCREIWMLRHYSVIFESSDSRNNHFESNFKQKIYYDYRMQVLRKNNFILLTWLAGATVTSKVCSSKLKTS